MTPEELLRPRYKVIASYPSMKSEGLSIGQILTCRNYDNDFSEKLWCEMNDAYPHLFKKLEWWMDRGIDDLASVEFVKVVTYREYWRVGDVVPCKLKLQELTPIGYTLKYNHYQPVFELLPATLTDYQNQSK